ncbi:MAG: hypothetical protein AB7G68_20775 [Nitrospiraceae bacterium]
MFHNRRLLIGYALAVMGGLQGCHSYTHSVIASTGTSIGVEISQNPATQVPQAKLGYQRVELAVVPTNRSAEKTTTAANSMGNGAKDHGEVIMELRYGGIFDTGKSSGIYQRLAVGAIAVTQPGAALMFARNAEGDIDQSVAAAITKIPAVDASAEHKKALIARKFAELYVDPTGNKSLLDNFEEAAKAAGYPVSQTVYKDYPAFRDFAGDLATPISKVELVRSKLEAKGMKF